MQQSNIPRGSSSNISSSVQPSNLQSFPFYSHPVVNANLPAPQGCSAGSPESSDQVPEAGPGAASPEPRTTAAQGLHVDFVEMQKPFLHNQPALSLLLSNPHNIRRLPSQLVYPSGKVSIGFFPSHWATSDNGNNDDSPNEDDDSRLARLQYGKVVAYASELEGSEDGPERLSSRAKHLALLLFCFAAFQVFWIAVILAGGELYPFSPTLDNYNDSQLTSLTIQREANRRVPTRSDYDVEENSNSLGPIHEAEVDNGFQRMIYCSLMAVHLLAVGGILFKLPIVVSLYNALQFVSGTLIAIFCLYSALDVVVLVSLVPVRFLGGRILDNMTAHVFTLKTT